MRGEREMVVHGHAQDQLRRRQSLDDLPWDALTGVQATVPAASTS